jgi:hypothetical protein
MKTTQDIETSIAHLRLIAFEIIESYKALANISNSSEFEILETRFHILRSTASFIIIRICALTDEIEKHLIESDNSEVNNAVNSFKYLCEPALDGINKWSEIRQYRHHVIAHNFRKGRQEKSILSNIENYDVPKTVGELRYVCECIRCINHYLLSFENVFGDPFEKYSNGNNENNAQLRITEENIESELLLMNKKNNDRIEELKRNIIG